MFFKGKTNTNSDECSGLIFN